MVVWTTISSLVVNISRPLGGPIRMEEELLSCLKSVSMMVVLRRTKKRVLAAFRMIIMITKKFVVHHLLL